MRFIKSLFFLLYSVLTCNAYGALLTGKVTDESGQALPFVVVYIDGTTNGTTANVDGIYSIDLKPGTYTIDYQLIGYTLHRETIEMGTSNVTRNIELKAEGIKISEVT